jgi:hypothetical protein
MIKTITTTTKAGRRLTKAHAEAEIVLGEFEGEDVYYVPLDSIIMRQLFRNMDVLRIDEAQFTKQTHPQIEGPAYVVATDVVNGLLDAIRELEAENHGKPPRKVTGPRNWEHFSENVLSVDMEVWSFGEQETTPPPSSSLVIPLEATRIFHSLPVDVMLYLFAFVSPWQRLVLMQTCKKWKDYLEKLATKEGQPKCQQILKSIQCIIGAETETHMVMQSYIQLCSSDKMHQKLAVLSKYARDIIALTRAVSWKRFQLISPETKTEKLVIPANAFALMLLEGSSFMRIGNIQVSIRRTAYELHDPVQYRIQSFRAIVEFSHRYWKYVMEPSWLDHNDSLYVLLGRIQDATASAAAADTADVPKFLLLLLPRYQCHKPQPPLGCLVSNRRNNSGRVNQSNAPYPIGGHEDLMRRRLAATGSLWQSLFGCFRPRAPEPLYYAHTTPLLAVAPAQSIGAVIEDD